MQDAPLTEWINSPQTKALRDYLHQRARPVIAMFLAGESVPPATQGRAAAFNEIAMLLRQPPEKLREIFRSASQQSEIL
jgi:hypothetical protein